MAFVGLQTGILRLGVSKSAIKAAMAGFLGRVQRETQSERDIIIDPPDARWSVCKLVGRVTK